jgi:hypothetical protein
MSGLTVLVALLICSCSNNAEVAKLKADVEAAGKEAAEAKALAEAVKAEVAKDRADAEAAKRVAAEAAARTKTDAEAARVKAAKDMAGVVSRWNAVADGLPTELPAPFGRVTFHWDGERFPHPTFKGGSAEAYGGFAKVLLAFLERSDNFGYLAANRLFTVNLRSGVPGGPKGPESGWTFAALVEQFSRPGSLGSHDEATRKALGSFSDRIQAAVKKQGI